MLGGGNYGGNSLGHISYTHLKKPFSWHFVPPTSSATLSRRILCRSDAPCVTKPGGRIQHPRA